MYSSVKRPCAKPSFVPEYRFSFFLNYPTSHRNVVEVETMGSFETKRDDDGFYDSNFKCHSYYMKTFLLIAEDRIYAAHVKVKEM